MVSGHGVVEVSPGENKHHEPSELPPSGILTANLRVLRVFWRFHTDRTLSEGVLFKKLLFYQNMPSFSQILLKYLRGVRRYCILLVSDII